MVRYKEEENKLSISCRSPLPQSRDVVVIHGIIKYDHVFPCRQKGMEYLELMFIKIL